VHFPAGERHLHLLVDDLFPRTQPRIGLSQPPPVLSLPHVDKEGLLCLLPDSVGTNPHEPVHVVQNVLDSAVTLLEDIFEGKHTDDFREEFLSYWAIACDEKGQPVQSLLNVNSPSRIVRVWRGTDRDIVGEDDASISAWIANYSKNAKVDCATKDALFLWLD